MVLSVPCRDGATAPAAPAATATTTAVQPAAAPVVQTTASTGIAALAGNRPLRIVTSTDYAPYIDQDQEQGGMLVEIVDTALQRVTTKDGYKIDWINDWSAHLQPLIEDGAYDLSLAWFRPNCDVRDKLSEGSQFRCDSLAWSDPLFEQIIGYYMRSSEAVLPTQHSELFGRTVCRPNGYSQFMMEEKDIVEPNVKIVTPDGPSDCMEMLVAGTTDAVVIATTVADDAISTLKISSQVVEVPELATVSTLNAVTSVNNPLKDQHLALLNDGLRQLREDGKWFEIVQRHLIAHARKTAATN
jgi:polar amino acid transport system substrate-binding protein